MQNDIEEIKLQIATSPFNTSTLSLSAGTTIRREGDAQELGEIATQVVVESNNTSTLLETQTDLIDSFENGENTPQDQPQSQNTQPQTPTINTNSIAQQEDNSPIQNENTPEKHNEPINGFKLICGNKTNQMQKKVVELPCTTFKQPKGIVPRMLYGAKGKKFVEILISRAERTGNELLMTWLNVPGLFQSTPREKTQHEEGIEEKIQRLSIKKFQFGNIGQSFKILQQQRQPHTKTQPTAEEIQKLFPDETKHQPLIYSEKETPIQISLEELTNIVSKLPRDRACGDSQLSYDHIKYALSKDETPAKMLQSSINFLLNNPESVNQQMYTATAHFLQKENGSFRPIVLQETLTKIAHRCLNRRLLAQIKGKMPTHQFCINCSNGTTTAALEIQKEIKENKDKYIKAVDFTNAFNSLSRHTLIDNMNRMNINKSYIKYIATYLERFKVKYKDQMIENKRGIPQGCPLSMTLFAIGTSHLIRIIEKKGVRVYAYADDMALIADSKEQMEEAMKTLETKAEECGLTINKEKTKGYTTKEGDEDEDEYASLHKKAWKYLGIPISLNQQLVKLEFSKTVDEVANKAEKAWKAPLLHQAYFINKLCIGPMLSHIARGTDLQGDINNFLTTQQKKIDKHMHPIIAKVPRAWRLQQVTEGGLGLTDVRLTQKAARDALLIETQEKTPDNQIVELTKKNENDQTGMKWQARLTKVLQTLVVEEQQTKMCIGEQRNVHEPESPSPYDSLWLSSPPTNPAQVLSDTAFSIGIQLRYNIDELINISKPCPFCGTQLTLKHSLVCPKANKGTFIARHNTVTRIIGTCLAAKGIITEYEKKLPIHLLTGC